MYRHDSGWKLLADVGAKSIMRGEDNVPLEARVLEKFASWNLASTDWEKADGLYFDAM